MLTSRLPVALRVGTPILALLALATCHFPFSTRSAAGPAPRAAAKEPAVYEAKICRWRDGLQAAVSLRFDDSHPTHVTKAFPLLQEYGLKGTFVVNPERPAYQEHRAAWEGEILRAGHELGDHTMTHRGAATDVEAEFEVGACADYLRKLPRGRGPLLPFVGGGATTWMQRKPRDYFLARYDLFAPGGELSCSEAYPGFGLPRVQERLARALERGGWLKMHFHQVDAGSLYIREETLRAIFALLREHRDRVWVAPITDLYQYEQERDASALWTEARDADTLVLRLACATDPRLFDQPLTLEIPLPPGAPANLALRDATGAEVPARRVGDALRFEAKPVDALYTVTGTGVGDAYRRAHPSTLDAPPAHPYVYFTREEIAGLRKKAEREPAAAMWEGVKREADRILEAAPPKPDDPLPAEACERGRSTSARASRLAFVYALTGDRRYADRARPEIEAALVAPTWVHSKHRGEADLVSAEIACNLALAYDWVHDALSPEERTRLREGVVRRGLEPILRDSEQGVWWAGWYRGNWGSVIHGQAGVAAMALLAEEPRAAAWVRHCRARIWHYTQAIDRDGGWGESVSYAGYAWVNATRFMDALKHVTRGEEDLFAEPKLRLLPQYFTHLFLPDESGFVPFSNCGGGPRLAGEFLYRLAAEYEDGHAEWMAQRMGRGGIFGLLWCDPDVAPVPPDDLPLTRLFQDIDWAVTRGRWADPAATLFALKGGQLDWDHQHHDHNHFVLYAHGRPLITDLNYPHQLWGCQTEAHNTIMVNGKEQRGKVAVAGCHGEADVRCELGDLVEAPWYTRLVGDATMSYDPADVKSYVREAMFLRHTDDGTPPDYVILFDDLVPTAPARLDWRLHTYGEMAVAGSRVTITQDEAAVEVTMLAPAAFRHEILSKTFEEAGVSKPFATAKADTFLTLGPAEPAARGIFLSVLAPRKADEAAAIRATPIEAANLAGARVACGAVEDVALFAIEEPSMDAAGVKATGRTCLVRRGPNGPSAAVLHQGTRLEAAGQTLYESNGSGHAVVTFGEKETTVVLDLYDARWAAVYARKAPTGAWLDGRPVEVRYSEEKRLAEMDVRAGRHTLRLSFE